MLNYVLIKRKDLVVVGEGKAVDRGMTQCPNCVSKFVSREFNVIPICQHR